MKKSIVLLFALFVGISQAHAVIADMGNEGRGGGGITRNGKNLSFATAGIMLSLEPMQEVPGLELLATAINNLTLPQDIRVILKKSYLNFSPREYYAVNADKSLSLKNITKIYESVIGRPKKGEKIAIFAVTTGNETYLFPEFFTLTETEKAAILWHETLWVIFADPKSKTPLQDYGSILDLEIRLQKYIESGFKFNRGLYLELSKKFDRFDISLEAAIEEDRLQGRTDIYLDSKGRLKYWALFDDLSIPKTDFINSDYAWPNEVDSMGNLRSIGSCNDKVKVSTQSGFLNLQQHPDSELLQLLYSYSATVKSESVSKLKTMTYQTVQLYCPEYLKEDEARTLSSAPGAVYITKKRGNEYNLFVVGDNGEIRKSPLLLTLKLDARQ